jgi:branched-chain amino acid transport system ATP-binding protein
MLKINNIDSYYGTSHVLFDVSLEVGRGDLVSLIGRNGAGKTTTLKSVIGLITPRSGSIEFQDKDILGLEPFEVSKRGIAYIPETRELFNELTVKENLRLGHLGHEIDNENESYEKIFEYFPRLEERKDQKAGSLSGGEQQMLTIARGLVSDPEFLLIDEPTEGLMPSLVDKLRDILLRINNEGITILLVEQNVEMALKISDYSYIIDEGAIVDEGQSGKLRDDGETVENYLNI